ncbi:MAG TPA: YsnF/AvaK domain-containing protein [Acidobacteriaceae bacterium]|nr:YsnF/AvaK domain-containing protein [Acidobacteriaceae bacterium]
MNPLADELTKESAAASSATAEITGQTIIPVFEESLSVAKRVVEKARVRVSRVTHDHQQAIDELLQHENVEVERVPVDRLVDAMPSVRQEGDLTIIPVVEEVVKVERHLLLKEEVHIRRVRHTERYQETVTLRRQEAVISRHPVEQPAVTPDGAGPNALNPGEENP